jgi:hypothetical protein
VPHITSTPDDGGRDSLRKVEKELHIDTANGLRTLHCMTSPWTLELICWVIKQPGFDSRQRLWGSPSSLSNEYRRFFSRGYSGRGEKLTTHLRLVRQKLIAYFSWYNTGNIENDASNNSSIVACVFVTAVTFLPSRCLANQIRWTSQKLQEDYRSVDTHTSQPCDAKQLTRA